MELDKKGALPRNLWGKKGLRALNCGVFLVADPVVCLIELNSQPKAYWVQSHLRRPVRLRLTVKRNGALLRLSESQCNSARA
jgi:hypothetical protein